jgi:hypothetical protein
MDYDFICDRCRKDEEGKKILICLLASIRQRMELEKEYHWSRANTVYEEQRSRVQNKNINKVLPDDCPTTDDLIREVKRIHSSHYSGCSCGWGRPYVQIPSESAILDASPTPGPSSVERPEVARYDVIYSDAVILSECERAIQIREEWERSYVKHPQMWGFEMNSDEACLYENLDDGDIKFDELEVSEFDVVKETFLMECTECGEEGCDGYNFMLEHHYGGSLDSLKRAMKYHRS